MLYKWVWSKMWNSIMNLHYFLRTFCSKMTQCSVGLTHCQWVYRVFHYREGLMFVLGKNFKNGLSMILVLCNCMIGWLFGTLLEGDVKQNWKKVHLTFLLIVIFKDLSKILAKMIFFLHHFFKQIVPHQCVCISFYIVNDVMGKVVLQMLPKGIPNFSHLQASFDPTF